MSKGSGVVWECQNCGAQFPKWTGQCPECQKWNSLVETLIDKSASTVVSKRSSRSGAPISPVEWQRAKASDKLHRPTTINELNRVLGGGLVPGGVVLIAGEPGIGKSTLLSQLALAEGDTLYINGEESNAQVGSRLKRLSGSGRQRITLFPETNIDNVIPKITSDYRLVIVDSIQVMYSPELRSAPGSIGQIRECGLRLIDAVKSMEVPVILVGHFTKSGEVAGPKLLEHMVDAVLVLEGERSGNFRILRAVKNRFGAVDEVGLFAMDNGDMKEVSNPGELLLGGAAGKVSGSVLGCTLEGLRPLILEVQALAVPSKLAVPRRVGQGISERKLQVLCAVIERYVNRKLGDMDIFVSIAGGLTSSDPGLDLAVVGAVISAMAEKQQVNRPTGQQDNRLKKPGNLPACQPANLASSIFCGEVGLLGEVRQVQGWERREKEVKRLGVGQLVGAAQKGSALAGANRIRNIRELQNLLK